MKMKPELVQTAISNYDYYTDGQKKVLTVLYQLSIDHIVTIKVANLAKITGYSRHMIYKALKQFKSDDVLETLKSGHKHTSLFKLNESKLHSIVDVYNKKLSVLSKNK